jgi:hypothetical protein
MATVKTLWLCSNLARDCTHLHITEQIITMCALVSHGPLDNSHGIPDLTLNWSRVSLGAAWKALDCYFSHMINHL